MIVADPQARLPYTETGGKGAANTEIARGTYRQPAKGGRNVTGSRIGVRSPVSAAKHGARAGGQSKSFSRHRAIIPRQMGRLCTICVHPERQTLDKTLETGRALRDIAAQFGVSKAALHRHYHHRLTTAEVVEKPSAEVTVRLPRNRETSLHPDT